jgi:hypothetical protein
VAGADDPGRGRLLYRAVDASQGLARVWHRVARVQIWSDPRIAAALLAISFGSACSLVLDGSDFRSDDDAGASPSDASSGAQADAALAPDAGLEVDAGTDEADAAPADVEAAGTYTLAVANGDNGCEFEGWDEGAVATGIPMRLTQEGTQVTAVIDGVTGLLLGVILGSNQLEGEVSGAMVNVSLYGTNSTTRGNCTYTINAVVDATLAGDYIDGRIEYRPSTNGSPACGVLNDCATVQLFNGTRPPE